jgi:hypothetical protein
MHTRSHYLKKLTLLLVAAAFIFPLVGAIARSTGATQRVWQLWSPSLEGFGCREQPPELQLSSWLAGDFQKQFDDWFTGNFGGRNFLVRLNNQLLYSAFRRSYMYQGRIVVANKDLLYELRYISDTFHQCNDSDKQRIQGLAANLERLQNALNKRGVAMVYAITPSKAVFCPAEFPEWSGKAKSDRRVYDELIAQLQQHHVNYVDGHKIMAQLQDEGEIQTYVRGGIHWTELAASKTLNQIIASINRQLPARSPALTAVQSSSNEPALPTVKPFSSVNASKPTFGKPDAIESDLALLLNLLRPDFNYPCEHVEFVASSPQLADHGKIIFEGCSFCSQLTSISSKAKLFSDMKHYFYYTQVRHSWPDGRHEQNIDPNKIDWDSEILNANAIVIENNEALDLDHVEKFVTDALMHTEQSRLANTHKGHRSDIAM